MSKGNILMIVTDQEYAHHALPAGVTLLNRDNPDFDEELQGRMETELNALIIGEIGDDQALWFFKSRKSAEGERKGGKQT